MKKHLIMYAVALATCMMFTSCSDEDGEGGGSISGKSAAGQLDDGQGNQNLPDGYRLLDVGGYYHYYYDKQGNLEQIYADGDTFTFSEKGFTIDYGDIVTKISMNNNGLVTDISSTGEGTEDGITANMTESYTFKYNSDRQLSSVSGNYKVTYKSKGMKYTESSKGSIIYTYSDKVLKNVVRESNYSEADGKGKETSTYTFDYKNNYENPYGQWTKYLLFSGLEDPLFEALSYAGCFGRATAFLPDVIHEEYEDIENGETSKDEDTYYCSYSYNQYGALSKADGYSYSYTTFAPDNLNKKVTQIKGHKRKPFLKSLFRQHTAH